MVYLKQFYILFFSFVLVASCGAKKGTSISGELKGAENMTIFFDKVSMGNSSEILLTDKVGSNGEFKFSLPEGAKKGFYRIRVGSQIADLIFDGSEKDVILIGNLAEMNDFNFTISGSPLTEQYTTTVQDYINLKMNVEALTNHTAKTAEPMVAYQLASRIFTFRPEFITLHKEVSQRLNAAHPDLDISKGYIEVVSQLDRQTQMMEASAKIKVGEMAPDIALPGPDGKIRKLSDYKGKLVLIDFWASWCGPCRKANPHVVEIYHRYKSKGFDVFSVSLDGLDSRTAQRFSEEGQLKEQMEAQKSRWVNAIQQDKLTWDGHVSDLKKWECAPAGEYGVRSIPQTFLVGRDGRIAAINPRNDLEQQIQKFL